MIPCDTLIRNATVFDGSGNEPEVLDVVLRDGRIAALGTALPCSAGTTMEARGLALAPGFIDVHTHDDTAVLRAPGMLPKLSQGVTTVIVGNCGISASPVTLRGAVPDPMNLLGTTEEFRFPTFESYRDAVRAAQPAVNVAALIGHTALRATTMDRLDRAATAAEAVAMREQLRVALDGGALGLSTGLAYGNARAATAEEVLTVAEPLAAAGGLYVTHMRTETEKILDAMEETFAIGRRSRVAVVISHLKCAGIANWGRSGEVLAAMDAARPSQHAGCDCYPYAAGSSTLDLGQVDPRVEITITWSETHPEVAGSSLAAIAEGWGLTHFEAARLLQPAGAIYHSISEDDMRRILAHPATMIGSDGLPLDPRPHPRLWGTFPRVLGRYSREQKLFTMAAAIHKMTAMPAQRFGLEERGRIKAGYHADLVLFDPQTIMDRATYAEPAQAAAGIHGVWINGMLSYTESGATGQRAGQFAARGAAHWI